MDRKKVKLLVLLAVLVALLAGAAALYGRLSDEVDTGPVLQEPVTEDETQGQPDTQKERVQAPDFTVYDADGRRETVETAAAFIADAGYTFPVYYDTDLSAAIAYGVNAIPASYFIDAEGNGVARAAGVLSRETLQICIDLLLGEPTA